MIKSREYLIECLKSFIGKPYVWGGESMQEGGFDCSGFIYAAFNKAGHKLKRSTAQVYSSTVGTRIKLEDAKAGDLLFFGQSLNKISHVAVFLGNGQMIESIGNSKNDKNHVGIGVKITKINRRKDLRRVNSIDEYVLDNSPMYYPVYTGTSASIVDVLKAVGEKDISLTHRKKIAHANDIYDYHGTYSQNIHMVRLAQKGKLIRG